MYRKVDKDYEALIEKLYDPDDPYGSTMWVIGEALTKGLNDDSYMNEHEYSLLVGIARAFVAADPYARCPSCGMMGSPDEGRHGYIDLDPGDTEVGPQPNVVPCVICNLEEAVKEGWEE